LETPLTCSFQSLESVLTPPLPQDISPPSPPPPLEEIPHPNWRPNLQRGSGTTNFFFVSNPPSFTRSRISLFLFFSATTMVDLIPSPPFSPLGCHPPPPKLGISARASPRVACSTSHCFQHLQASPPPCGLAASTPKTFVFPAPFSPAMPFAPIRYLTNLLSCRRGSILNLRVRTLSP